MQHLPARTVRFLAPLLLAALCLGGCTCDHVFREATCLAPATCIRCGKTQGEALPHVFTDTTCIAPSPCAVCGTLDGIELTHQWREDGKLCLLCGLDKRTTDERFLDELALGLSERWQSIHPREEISALTGQMEPHPKSDWEKAFAAEYDRLAAFVDADFRDPLLGQWAAVYIESTESAIAVLDLFQTPAWDAAYTNWIYHDRTLALYKIHEICPIPVPAEERETLSLLLDGGRTLDAVNRLCEGVNFHDIGSKDGKHRREAIVVNDTGLDFEFFDLTVNLADETGTALETKVFSLKNWKNGEKETLSFITDTDFKTIDIPHAVWRLKEATADAAD